MITLYTGTPGSGKSYHVAYKMYHGLRFKRTFICNFQINLDNTSLTYFSYLKKKLFSKTKNLKHRKLGNFIYCTNDKLSPKFLLDYAKANHSLRRESETVVIIDECQKIFNSREWNAKDRLKWIDFFSMHRHYGFDIILLTQSDRLIDRQIRSFIEYDVRHRKMNNYKLFGAILGLLSGGPLFGCVTYWYGVRERIGFEMLTYKKRIASIYDTFLLFDDVPKEEKTAVPDKGCPEGGVPLAGTDVLLLAELTEQKSTSYHLTEEELKDLFSLKRTPPPSSNRWSENT